LRLREKRFAKVIPNPHEQSLFRDHPKDVILSLHRASRDQGG
jgi:hypothetical protein